jgi:hypothetical protein
MSIFNKLVLVGLIFVLAISASGVGGGPAAAAPQEMVLKTLTIGPTRFIPNDLAINYSRAPNSYYSITDGEVQAPLNLPRGATIHKMTLFMEESDGVNNTCLFLATSNPALGDFGWKTVVKKCTKGAVLGVRKFTRKGIGYTVEQNKDLGLYIFLYSGMKLFGVKIYYSN